MGCSASHRRLFDFVVQSCGIVTGHRPSSRVAAPRPNPVLALSVLGSRPRLLHFAAPRLAPLVPPYEKPGHHATILQFDPRFRPFEESCP